jgi:hypothetical protein
MSALTSSPESLPASLEISAPNSKTGGVTVRATLLSLMLAAFFGYVIPIVDFKCSNTFLGAMHMPAGAVAVLMALLLIVNPLLRLVSSRAGFRRNEILTVYITCLFSTLIPGRGAENFFVPNILSSFYFATRENKWLGYLTPYIKSWMSPAVNAAHKYNEGPVRGWYEGTNGVVPWDTWLTPLLAWGSLILAIQIMHGCLAVLLRAQWAEREALSFPLLRLPLEMTEDADDLEHRGGSKIGAFFRNPLVWCGFGLAVVLEGVNGLSLYFPDLVPPISLGLNPGPYLSEAPWNQIYPIQIQIFPAIVGVSYLLTSEVSFSLWFFHLFSKGQLIIAYMMGFSVATLDTPFWTRGWAKGFIGYQQVGALIAYVGILLWLGREHWRHVVRRAMGRAQATEEERGEALSYPVAFWGMLAAMTFIVGWTVASGVRLDLALLLWAFYLSISLALTRLVAEAGLLFVQTGWMPLGPMAFLVGAGQGKIIDAVSGPPAAMISSSLMLDMRGFLLPSYLQSFKLAHDEKIPAKRLLALISACVLISFLVGTFMVVQLGYTNGGLQLQKWWATGNSSQVATHAVGFAKGLNTSYSGNWFWVAVGALATIGMMAARSRFTWFPFHPIGLVMCVPFAMHAMWLSILLGWACKVIITRFGGSDTYRKTTPFFLGIVLGDIMMVVFWICVDGWQGRTNHALLPF